MCSKIHTFSLIAFSHCMSLSAKCQTVFDSKESFTDANKRLTVAKPAALKDRKWRICSTVYLSMAASSQKGLALIYRLVSHSGHSFTASSRVKTCWQLWTTGSTHYRWTAATVSRIMICSRFYLWYPLLICIMLSSVHLLAFTLSWEISSNLAQEFTWLEVGVTPPQSGLAITQNSL